MKIQFIYIICIYFPLAKGVIARSDKLIAICWNEKLNMTDGIYYCNFCLQSNLLNALHATIPLELISFTRRRPLTNALVMIPPPLAQTVTLQHAPPHRQLLREKTSKLCPHHPTTLSRKVKCFFHEFLKIVLDIFAYYILSIR